MALLWLTLAALALSYWEAATVTALRRALQIPDGASNILVLGRLSSRLLCIEQGRELCSLLALVLLSGLAAESSRHAAVLFGWSFALRNLAYYGWLRVFVGYPRSLVVLDVFCLLPRPWIGPVWLPLLLSTLIAGGCGSALLLGAM
ncbi:hypothetical protein HRbin21_01584 [bacterium HR21]|nr:hypothetical protein HRbin21_01584 [bacterium HR21]